MPAASRSTRSILRPHRLIDGVGEASRTGFEVVIEDGRISAVRESGTTDVEGTELIELPAATLLPGLIDCHVHYTIDPRLEVADGIAEGATNTSAASVLIGARNARLALASGVTTARSAGASRGLDIPLAAAIERGDVPGPRLVPAGAAITITGGHGRHFGVEVDSIPEMVRAVRVLARDGARVIKLVASEAAMLTSDLAATNELTVDEMSAMVGEARRLKRKVLAHAQSPGSVIAAAEAGVDSVEHAFLATEPSLEALKRSGAFLTPTLTVTDVYADLAGRSERVRLRQLEISERHRASCEMAVALGVPLVAGTDCGVRGIFADMLPREIELLADHGLAPMQAIRAATLHASELLGLSEDIGSIEVGKRADLLAVPGDPLRDLRALRHPVRVFKGGVDVTGADATVRTSG